MITLVIILIFFLIVCIVSLFKIWAKMEYEENMKRCYRPEIDNQGTPPEGDY